MRIPLLSSLVMSLLVGAPAAASGLEWNWDDGVKRQYLIRSQVLLPQFMQFNKELNRDARVTEFLVSLVTTCEATTALGKTKYELRCDVDDFSITGSPAPSDAGKLLKIFNEMDQKLVDGGWVQIVFAKDGRIIDYDLEGVDKRNSRNRHIQENMRLVLGRLFAAMDLQLPPGGKEIAQPWEQKSSPLAMHFPSEYGTFGSAQVTHQITKREAGVVIATSGRGALGPAEFISVRTGGADRIKNQYDLEYQGITVFDDVTGTMTEHEYMVDGMPTPSSMAAEGGEGVSYVQMTRLELLAEGGPVPKLGDNEEVPPTRTTASAALQK